MPILNANDYKMACAEQGATAQCCFINNLNVSTPFRFTSRSEQANTDSPMLVRQRCRLP